MSPVGRTDIGPSWNEESLRVYPSGFANNPQGACGVSWLSCKRSPLPASPTAQEGSSGPWFEEVAEASFVRFEHVFAVVQRYYLPEIMSGGVGLLDYDGDGYLDIHFVQGGDLDPSTLGRPGNRMYRNLGDATFEDVTASTRTGDTAYGMGCFSSTVAVCPCNSRVSGHFDRGIQWVTGENKHFVPNSKGQQPRVARDLRADEFKSEPTVGLAEYEDVNGAERLRFDPAMRRVV